jgi:hypothetical protein
MRKRHPWKYRNTCLEYSLPVYEPSFHLKLIVSRKLVELGLYIFEFDSSVVNTLRYHVIYISLRFNKRQTVALELISHILNRYSWDSSPSQILILKHKIPIFIIHVFFSQSSQENVNTLMLAMNNSLSKHNSPLCMSGDLEQVLNINLNAQW